MDILLNEQAPSKEALEKNIAGEIVFSKEPGKTLKKWREHFSITQKELAKELGINPSVVCDYESGRRKSPGIFIVRKYINGMLSVDEKKGSKIMRNILRSPEISNVVLGMKEFFSGVPISDFCKLIDSDVLVSDNPKQEIYGYTVIDSIKAISQLSFNDLIKLYGSTTQRALIFTKVSTGRTPMVAIKLTKLKPGLVVLHGLNEVDDLAKVIAKDEKIPLALCKLGSESDIVEKLKILK